MHFKHKPVEIQELSTQTINRKRFYRTPEGKLYPSITTVLQKQKMKGLMEWRQKVGDDVANYIARTAANRGTKVHHMCEDFLNNNFDEEIHKKNFLPYVLFGQIKPVLMQKVNNIFAQECGLYSDKYRVAGRVDCIAEYNGTPSIIDFKTSTKERNDEWNESYYIQASAYAEMFEERTGIEINQIVILVVTEDGIVQEFVKDKSEYLEKLIDAVDDFTTDWEKENEMVHNSGNDNAA
jgi:genome maintenance exonuclease 1